MRAVRIFETPEALGEAVAADIAARMKGHFLLGCPGGRSPKPVYAALARRNLDLSGLIIVMMDDYLTGVAGALTHVDAAAPLFAKAGVKPDEGFVSIGGPDDFAGFVKTCRQLRLWPRESKVKLPA